MDSNDKTIKAYEERFKEYAAVHTQTIASDRKPWLDHVLTFVPKQGLILEIGSADGLDAAYIESKGFNVIRSDATKSFVDLLRSQGYNARLVNAIKDDLGHGYDMIFAYAVFLHFTIEQLDLVLNKIHKSLKPGGVLVFTVKAGVGSEWTTTKLGLPRFFQYWQEPNLKARLEAAKFEIVEISKRAGSTADWLQVIARK